MVVIRTVTFILHHCSDLNSARQCHWHRRRVETSYLQWWCGKVQTLSIILAEMRHILSFIFQGCFTSARLLASCVSPRHSQAPPHHTKTFSSIFCPGAVWIRKDVEARSAVLLWECDVLCLLQFCFLVCLLVCFLFRIPNNGRPCHAR